MKMELKAHYFKSVFLVSFFDYYLEDIGKIRTFALSMKKDEICGLTE